MVFGLSSKELAIIMVNVAFAATFLTIFFFTYASHIEKEIVMNNMSYLTNDMLRDILLLVPKNQENIVVNKLTSIKIPDMSKEDAENNENNKKILKQAVTVVGAFLCIVLLSTFYMSKKYNFSYENILKLCLLTVSVIAIVEFFFLRFFASKFLAADANFIKYTILDTLQNYAKN